MQSLIDDDQKLNTQDEQKNVSWHFIKLSTKKT
jgi:hypothetical protein